MGGRAKSTTQSKQPESDALKEAMADLHGMRGLFTLKLHSPENSGTDVESTYSYIEQSIADLSRALEFDKSRGDLRSHRGLAYASMGQFQLACDDYK